MVVQIWHWRGHANIAQMGDVRSSDEWVLSPSPKEGQRATTLMSGTPVTGRRGPNHRLIMQVDGNLVIQHGADFPIWYRLGDSRVAGSYLWLQCDKNVVLYTPSGGIA